MKFRITVIACGTALLIAAAVGAVVASRNRRQPLPLPDVPVAASPAEVRVKAVERKPEPSDHEVIEASAAVAIVCGADSATADRYEARNDALRSIARRRDLPEGDVVALMDYLADSHILRHVDGRYHWMAEDFPASEISRISTRSPVLKKCPHMWSRWWSNLE